MLIAAVEDYFVVPKVPGARANAEAWHSYLRMSRGVPLDHVTLIRDAQVTKESLLAQADEAAKAVGEGGTLWFVFIGHGAASPDRQQGVLVGADAQQTANGLYARSIAREEILTRLAKSKAARIVVVIDSCFSGKAPNGEPLGKGLQPLVLKRKSEALDPRAVLFSAAQGDEFAGALPGAERPAFSYLLLGGLRGWADADGNGEVTAGELQSYAAGALRALLAGSRTQTPTVEGGKEASLGKGWEKGPDLDSMVLAGPKLAPVPQLGAAVDGMPPAPAWKGPGGAALALAADVEVLEARDKAVRAEEGGSAESKLEAWKSLAAMSGRNPYKAEAEERANGWGDYLARKPALDAYGAAVKVETTGSPAEKRVAWAKLADIADRNPWREKARAQMEAWAEYERQQLALVAAGETELTQVRRVLRLKSVPRAQKDALVASYGSRYGQVAPLMKELDEAKRKADEDEDRWAAQQKKREKKQRAKRRAQQEDERRAEQVMKALEATQRRAAERAKRRAQEEEERTAQAKREADKGRSATTAGVAPGDKEVADRRGAYVAWGHASFWTGVGLAAAGGVAAAMAAATGGVAPGTETKDLRASRAWAGAMWGSVGAAGALVATGLTLWILAPSTAARVVPSASALPGGATLGIAGRW